MEQFRFPLQKLLDIRIDKEEESKQNFVEATRQKDMAEQRLTSIKSEYSKYNVVSKNDTLIEQKIKKNYLNALNMSMQQASTELNDRVERLEESREDLMQKQIDRKTVEILKDKKQQAYIKEQNRLEQVTNDEFALYAYVRHLERG